MSQEIIKQNYIIWLMDWNFKLLRVFILFTNFVAFGADYEHQGEFDQVVVDFWSNKRQSRKTICQLLKEKKVITPAISARQMRLFSLSFMQRSNIIY